MVPVVSTRKWSRWSVLALVLGTIVGLGVSALGAPESDADDSFRPAELAGKEKLYAILDRKIRAVDRREATLQAREADLRAAEEQIENRLGELQGLRDQIRVLLSDLDENRELRMVHLVKMFETMRANQAASILAVSDDKLALEILRRMNRSKAGKALAQMPTERASDLAEKLGGPALFTERR